MQDNIILNTDSYKTSMFVQYPPKTEYVYSYIESRGGMDECLYFGLQGFIKKYLLTPITQEMIDTAGHIIKAHGMPFNREGWEYILKEHNGYLPLKICSAPEGYVITTKNVLVTVVNTDPKCFWLTTYVETALLRAIWYPTTVATTSKRIKNIILKYLKETGTPEAIDFKLHDFGFRGVSSKESAGIGGAGHLINFKGTDTIEALLYAHEYYNSPLDDTGFSIGACEHSTITSWGRENELQAYSNMVKQFGKPGSLFAVVSDSYDIYNACEKIWGEELKQQVIDSGATPVIRLDSGDPVEVCYRAVNILGNKFGYTTNDKGYKLLNHVRLIQGDGIDEEMIVKILDAFKKDGWSADNIAFGMGGALLQKLDRDTLKFAMKCSAICIDGVWSNVQKDPITDQGKRSKVGQIKLWKNEQGVVKTSEECPSDDFRVFMNEVFLNGKLTHEVTFDEVRENSNV